MPTDDDISISIATQEDLDKLYQNEVVAKQVVAGIDALEKEGVKKTSKIKQQLKQIEGVIYASQGPLSLRQRPVQAAGGPNAFGVGDSPILGGQTSNLPKGFTTPEVRELKKKVDEHEKVLGGIKQQYANLTGFINNPAGFLQNKLMGILGKAGVAGMIAVFGYEVITDIFDMIKEQFGPGGLWDVRKLVRDQTKDFLPENQLNYYRSGETFFANVRGKIDQLPPYTSNTEKLVDGHMRFLARSAGT